MAKNEHWKLNNNGMIVQTSAGKDDPNTPLFQEAVEAHNKAIEDSKEKPEPEK